MSVFILLFVLLMKDGSIHPLAQVYPTSDTCTHAAAQVLDISHGDDQVNNAFWVCEELPLPAGSVKGSI